MKVTFTLPDGRTFTEEYDEPQQFIAEQLADYDTIPDEYEVIALEIDGQSRTFTGTIGDLFNQLIKS